VYIETAVRTHSTNRNEQVYTHRNGAFESRYLRYAYGGWKTARTLLEYLRINAQLDPARPRSYFGQIPQICLEPMNAVVHTSVRGCAAISPRLMARPFSLNYDGSVHREQRTPVLPFAPAGGIPARWFPVVYIYIYTRAPHYALIWLAVRKNSYLLVKVRAATLKSQSRFRRFGESDRAIQSRYSDFFTASRSLSGERRGVSPNYAAERRVSRAL